MDPLVTYRPSYHPYKDERKAYPDPSIKDRNFFKKYIGANPESLFCRQLEQEIANDKTGFETYRGMMMGFKLSTPLTIMTPNFFALKNVAKRYLDKYGILISFANSQHLFDSLNALIATTTTPTYIGILVGSDIEEKDAVHITPILVYLSGDKSKSNMEVIIMDSKGDESFRDIFIEYGISENNVYATILERQADRFSCRTGGLVLLRNALLAIRYHNCSNGFKEALNEAAIIEGNKINYLPPEWDYTEQFKNPSLKSHHLAIRSLFSKSKPCEMSAEDFRMCSDKEIIMKCKIWSNGGFPKEITANPPQGTVFRKSSRNGWKVQFEIKNSVNTYLVEKGKKEARELKKRL